MTRLDKLKIAQEVWRTFCRSDKENYSHYLKSEIEKAEQEKEQVKSCDNCDNKKRWKTKQDWKPSVCSFCENLQNWTPKENGKIEPIEESTGWHSIGISHKDGETPAVYVDGIKYVQTINEIKKLKELINE